MYEKKKKKTYINFFVRNLHTDSPMHFYYNYTYNPNEVKKLELGKTAILNKYSSNKSNGTYSKCF